MEKKNLSEVIKPSKIKQIWIKTECECGSGVYAMSVYMYSNEQKQPPELKNFKLGYKCFVCRQ